MSEPFVGEIRMFAGTFSPQGWAFCDGQLLNVSQNDALFSLLGTIYGGDGRTTFGVPDLRGRLVVHAGHGPGLSPRTLGAKGGTETETLTPNNLAAHSHGLVAGGTANADFPGGHYPGTSGSDNYGYSISGALDNNVMPYTCINYIISLFGVYPSRS